MTEWKHHSAQEQLGDTVPECWSRAFPNGERAALVRRLAGGGWGLVVAGRDVDVRFDTAEQAQRLADASLASLGLAGATAHGEDWLRAELAAVQALSSHPKARAVDTVRALLGKAETERSMMKVELGAMKHERNEARAALLTLLDAMPGDPAVDIEFNGDIASYVIHIVERLVAARDSARAELARLREASPAVKAAASMEPPNRFSRTDAELVAHAVRYAHEPGLVRWSTVGARFGLGSTSAHALCRAVGVDPYEREPLPSECPYCGDDLGGEE